MNTAMINNLVSVAADISYGEKIINGLIVVVIGMLAIFAVLAILMGVLSLFKVFFYDIPEKKKAEALNKAKEAAASEPAPAVEDTAADEAEDDTQLIAVITAAIAAYRASQEAEASPALPFRVVSYKRVRGAGGWSGADENETF